MDIMLSLAKSYLKSLVTKEDLINLLNKLLLNDKERTVLEKIYLEHKSISIIADDLGYSIQNIKVLHRKALLKVSSYIHKSVDI